MGGRETQHQEPASQPAGREKLRGGGSTGEQQGLGQGKRQNAPQREVSGQADGKGWRLRAGESRAQRQRWGRRQGRDRSK